MSNIVPTTPALIALIVFRSFFVNPFFWIHYGEHKQLQYQNILSLSIEPTLKRGFVLSQSEGKYITSAKQAKHCKQLILMYHDGNITTEIQHDWTI